MIPRVALPGGAALPRLGLGTWNIGDGDRERTRTEIASLRLGIELGMTLIDTAEMYGDGASERVVGEAIASCRDDVVLVTKVRPAHASAAGIRRSCAASLRRLGTERLDLYLLHWRGGEDLGEVVEAFEALRRAGDIGAWGVSNFDAADLEELAALPEGARCATDQVLYNPAERGIEFDLLPWCAARRMPVMAYSPVGQGGRLLRDPAVGRVAARHGVSPAAACLAWVLRQEGVVAIPKAADPAHVRENARAVAVALDPEDLAALDAAFPPPRSKRPLAML